MISLSDFTINFCPSCGKSLGSRVNESKDVVEIKHNHTKCPYCGFSYQIQSNEGIFKKLVYPDDQVERDDYKLIVGSIPNFTKNHLMLRYLKVDEFWELALIINPDTKVGRIRDGWRELRQKVEILQRYQGRKQGYAFQFYYEFVQIKKLGWRHAQIAEQINFDCLVNLARIIDPNGDKESKQIGFENFIFLLRFVRMKRSEIEENLYHGIEKLDNNKIPWIPKAGIVDKIECQKLFSYGEMMNKLKISFQFIQMRLSYYRFYG